MHAQNLHHLVTIVALLHKLEGSTFLVLRPAFEPLSIAGRAASRIRRTGEGRVRAQEEEGQEKDSRRPIRSRIAHCIRDVLSRCCDDISSSCSSSSALLSF